MSSRIILVAAWAAFLVGCGSAEVKPFEHGSETKSITIDEKRIWYSAKRFDTAIRNQGSIYQDQDATQYLQSVMDKLFPEFKGKIRVQIVKTPVLNAFALPNGSIYMHLGMLARIDNEAQLAAILAHEGAHFLMKHGYYAKQNADTMGAVAMGMAIAGIPALPELLFYSSISGFSQESEREADRMAFDRMRAAGYDTSEGPKLFEHMIAELKTLDIDEPYFFSSHPKLQERVDSFADLHKQKGNSSGEIKEGEYLTKTEQIRLDCMKADLSMDRYKSMILVLQQDNAEKKFGAYGDYFLGEAYRRRAKEDDYDKAAESYKAAIRKMPDYAPSYKALGLYYMKKGEYTQAKSNFNKYLEMANGNDSGYVKQYLKQIEQKGI